MNVNKYTVAQWVKHPTTLLLIFTVTIIQALIQHTVRRSDTSTKECMEQVEYLRVRVDKLESQLDEYTRAVMFKDMQIKKQTQAIDSLKRKGNNEHF